MFSFKEQDLTTKEVGDNIGSREKYIDFIKEHTLTKEEKDILLQASISVKKKEPNKKVITDAYRILLQLGVIEEEKTEYSQVQDKEIKEELISADEYATQTNTRVEEVISSIKSGELAGKVISHQWFVDTQLSKSLASTGYLHTKDSISEKKNNNWLWLIFGLPFVLATILSIVQGHFSEFHIFYFLLVVSIATIRFLWNFLFPLKTQESVKRPIGVKLALYALQSALLMSVMVGLYAMISMLTYDNPSYLTSHVFKYIGLVIAISIVLNWYIIKGIGNRLLWVKTLYLIFVFISLFTFFPSMDSIAWMKGIYRANFVIQELLNILAAIGLLLPSSNQWFESTKGTSKASFSTINNSSTKSSKEIETDDQSYSYIEEIKKLGELKKDGLLSEEEFVNKKKELLGN